MVAGSAERLGERVAVWLSRCLCVIFAGLVALFALDAFDADASVWHNASALRIHLIPTGLILAALAVAWHRLRVGGLLLFGLGVAYLVLAWHQLRWWTARAIPGPLILLGVLFFGSWTSGWRGSRSS